MIEYLKKFKKRLDKLVEVCYNEFVIFEKGCLQSYLISHYIEYLRCKVNANEITTMTYTDTDTVPPTVYTVKKNVINGKYTLYKEGKKVRTADMPTDFEEIYPDLYESDKSLDNKFKRKRKTKQKGDGS